MFQSSLARIFSSFSGKAPDSIAGLFDAAPPRLAPALEPTAEEPILGPAVSKLISETRSLIDRQIEMAKQKALSRPKLFETAYAAADIFQMHLSRARAETEPPDILLEPDVRHALPSAFDRADEFIAEGRRALFEKRREIEALLR